MIEADWVKVAVDIGQFVATGAVGVYVWLSDRDRARASALSQMGDDVDARLDRVSERLARIEASPPMSDATACSVHTSRITALEEAMRHGPKIADLTAAHKRMDTLSEAVAEMRGGITRIERQLNMVSEYLLNHHQTARD